MKKMGFIVLTSLIILISGCAPEPGLENEGSEIVGRYIELAESYIDSNELEKANDVLQEGYLETGDEALLQYIKEIEQTTKQEEQMYQETYAQ